MHGNVNEWCAHFYDFDFYETPEATGTDPVCVFPSSNRVDRGDSASLHALRCRSAVRGSTTPETRDPEIGFRIAYYPLP